MPNEIFNELLVMQLIGSHCTNNEQIFHVAWQNVLTTKYRRAEQRNFSTHLQKNCFTSKMVEGLT